MGDSISYNISRNYMQFISEFINIRPIDSKHGKAMIDLMCACQRVKCDMYQFVKNREMVPVTLHRSNLVICERDYLDKKLHVNLFRLFSIYTLTRDPELIVKVLDFIRNTDRKYKLLCYIKFPKIDKLMVNDNSENSYEVAISCIRYLLELDDITMTNKLAMLICSCNKINISDVVVMADVDYDDTNVVCMLNRCIELFRTQIRYYEFNMLNYDDVLNMDEYNFYLLCRQLQLMWTLYNDFKIRFNILLSEHNIDGIN